MTKRGSVPLFTAAALVIIYWLTLAPGVTLWDSGEFLAAIRTLGIPHPAGTPLYVLVAKCWSFLFAPVFGFARSINVLSAAATAAGCAIVASLFSRWMENAAAGICAGLISGAMSTVWLNATETEVYALAFLLGCIVLWVADRAGRSGESRWAMLAVYLCGLGWALHLSALVVVPSAVFLGFAGRDGYLAIPSGTRRADGRRTHTSAARLALAALPLILLGASCVLYLLIRARHDPAINQGNPSTWSALLDVLDRRQYGERSLLPRSAPLYLQIGNLIEYSDWQVALALHTDPEPSLLRTSMTVLYVVLGVYGCVLHRRADHRSWRAWMTLIVATSLGVILYLNMKLSPSFGYGLLPEGAAREARERAYFFAFVFVAWGAWAGVGVARLSRLAPKALKSLPLVLVAVPFALNWRALDRTQRAEDVRARENALETLSSLPARSVFLAIGDNDTYPLWYLQQVEQVRRDVTVVTVPLLSASWYRAELARRHELLKPGEWMGWSGTSGTVALISHNAAGLNRPVVTSTYEGASPLSSR